MVLVVRGRLDLAGGKEAWIVEVRALYYYRTWKRTWKVRLPCRMVEVMQKEPRDDCSKGWFGWKPRTWLHHRQGW